jgi:hypothetical protein
MKKAKGRMQTYRTKNRSRVGTARRAVRRQNAFRFSLDSEAPLRAANLIFDPLSFFRASLRNDRLSFSAFDPTTDGSASRPYPLRANLRSPTPSAFCLLPSSFPL